MLELKNIAKSFSQGETEIPVLWDLNLSLEKGESIAVLGQSGSGKSTLLSLLAGIDRPDKGEVFFEKRSLAPLNEEELTKLRAHKIGIIFQQFHLLPHLKAFENVALVLEINGIANAKEKACEMLKEVGLSHRLEHYPSQLSGGEKQRVAIARSLAIEPELILADEPSGSLDEKTGKEVIQLLFDLVEKKSMSLILVTHNQQLAKRCSKTYLLDEGKLKLKDGE